MLFLLPRWPFEKLIDHSLHRHGASSLGPDYVRHQSMAEHPYPPSHTGDMQRLSWTRSAYSQNAPPCLASMSPSPLSFTLQCPIPQVGRSCTSPVRRSTVSSPRFPGFPLSNRDSKSGPKSDASPYAQSGNTNGLPLSAAPVMGSKSSTPRLCRPPCNSHLSHRRELVWMRVARDTLTHRVPSHESWTPSMGGSCGS